MLKDATFRRRVAASFASTTRDQQEAAYRSHTHAPDVGKYTPKFCEIDKMKRQLKIAVPHEDLGLNSTGDTCNIGLGRKSMQAT